MSIQNSISNAIKGSIINGGGPAGDFSTRSLSFDGVDDYVSTSEVYSELDGQTKATFSLWVKPQLNQYGILFHIPRNTTSTQGQVLCFLDNSYRVRWSMDTTSYYSNSLTNVITLDAWNHILICIDLTQGVSQDRSRVFINGVNQTAVSNLSTRNAFSTSTGSLLIGEETLGYLTPFLGNIDEFAIWSGVDLRNDVATIYNNGKPADLTSLNPTSWYRAGENSTFAYPQILMPENSNKDKVSKYSLDFDGLSYVDCGDTDEFSFGNGTTDSRFSLSAWIYMNDATDFAIMSKYDTNVEYQFFVTSADRILFRLFSGGTTLNRIGRQTDPVTSFENQWIHVAATYDGSSTLAGIKIYLNGNRVDTTDSSLNTYVAMSNTNASFEIGRISAVYADGKIDEAAVFPVELGLSDVQAIYNSGIPTDISSYSPVGYWKLGEEAKFTDNWLVSNSALSNFSKYSFNFDGLDDYIDCGNNANLQPTTEVSVSAWFKSSSSTRQTIASRTYYRLRLGLTGELEWAVFENISTAVIAVTSGVNYADDQWHNVVCTHQTNGRSKIYVDGTLQADIAGLTTNIFNTSIEFLIGRRNFSVAQFFIGNIDEVAVWTSELSAGEVAAIYNGGKPKDLSGLSPVSWWRMGEEATYDGGTSQFTIPDQGSGGNNGTSSNTMLLETLVGDTPQYYGGGISDSMDIFDRVGDAPNSENNTVSFNMEEADIVEDTP